MNDLSAAEREAASVVAGLSGKHGRGEDPDAAAGGSMPKRSRVEEWDPLLAAAGNVEPVPVVLPQQAPMQPQQQAQRPPQPQPNVDDLQPYPFFYYKDYSTKPDPDSLTPLTPPGRVPNFPAKMHAILARSDLADIITWMPHGRSWKVLKPREFEVRVIPVYFEHAKFSSFIRQANGWGFRRISTGRDRNSYYHPMFLRGMPYLCKDMKRPGVSKKLAADPDHEPDLYAISEMHPLPDRPVDDAILLKCVLEGGPKARMPIYTGVLSSSLSSSKPMFSSTINAAPEQAKAAAVASLTAPVAPQLAPVDKEALATFQASLGGLDINQKPAATTPTNLPNFVMPPLTAFTTPSTLQAPQHKTGNALGAANQLAFGGTHPGNLAAAFQASSAASQFAAGFAAAAALSHQQFQNMMDSLKAPPAATMPAAAPPSVPPAAVPVAAPAPIAPAPVAQAAQPANPPAFALPTNFFPPSQPNP